MVVLPPWWWWRRGTTGSRGGHEAEGGQQGSGGGGGGRWWWTVVGQVSDSEYYNLSCKAFGDENWPSLFLHHAEPECPHLGYWM